MADKAAHEDVLAFEIDARDVGGKLGKFGRDAGCKIWLNDLVGVEAEDPIGGDGCVVERPLELLSLVNKGFCSTTAPSCFAISIVRSVEKESTTTMSLQKDRTERIARSICRSSLWVRMMVVRLVTRTRPLQPGTNSARRIPGINRPRR